MTVLNVVSLTQVPELLLFAKGLFPTVEVKGVICSPSRKEAVLDSIRAVHQRVIVVLCVVSK